MSSFTSTPEGGFQAVLFDLDGTLVDTAPDMVAVLQAMQMDRDIEPVAYDLGRSFVSNGSVECPVAPACCYSSR